MVCMSFWVRGLRRRRRTSAGVDEIVASERTTVRSRLRHDLLTSLDAVVIGGLGRRARYTSAPNQGVTRWEELSLLNISPSMGSLRRRAGQRASSEWAGQTHTTEGRKGTNSSWRKHGQLTPSSTVASLTRASHLSGRSLKGSWQT